MTMYAREALEALLDGAATWAENAEESFPRRIDPSDTDETCAELATESGWADPEDIARVRDIWRAVEVVQKLLQQRGCEALDPACDGTLTHLIDIVMNG